MVGIDTIVTAALGIGGIIVTFVVTRWYYKRSYEDLQRLGSQLESLSVSQFRIMNAQNPNQEGELFKGSDGKWGVKWKRSLQESVSLEARVDAKLNPESSGEKDS